LAHGGLQTQIEQTKAALEAEGVDVEYLRWWDEAQRGDVIHYFGRPTSTYIEQAHVKEMKVVLAELLSGPGSRSAQARAMQKLVMRTAARVLSPTLLHK
jgi:carbamate kinase